MRPGLQNLNPPESTYKQSSYSYAKYLTYDAFLMVCGVSFSFGTASFSFSVERSTCSCSNIQGTQPVLLVNLGVCFYENAAEVGVAFVTNHAANMKFTHICTTGRIGMGISNSS